MENQSDLEVILDFLEEYYRQNSAESMDMTSEDNLDETSLERWRYSDPSIIKSEVPPYLDVDLSPVLSHSVSVANVPTQSVKHQPQSGRKVRLYHFLFEMLEDPNMSHCVSWVPAASGVFRFSSRNKDQVAALWGQRKGNKRLMTYQKMSRALRNYAQSGEIFKVKKKLTYQFSRDTLMILQQNYRKDF